MEKKENYIILKIISVILILYFLNLYYDYYQIKKRNEMFKEIGRKFKENNQQFSPNYQTQTKENNQQFSANYSREITYTCKFYSSEPKQNSLDLSKIKLVLYIDYKNKTVRSEQGVDLFSVEFKSDKVSWFHEFVNSVNQERLSYNTFYIDSKNLLSNIYPLKKNLSQSDLVAITEWNCK